MQTAVKFLKNRHFDILSFNFDCCMIRNTLKLNESTINQLNKHVFKTTNYNIEFCMKPIEPILEIPEDELIFENDIEEIENDVEAVEILLPKLGKKVVKCGCRYFIQKNNSHIYQEDLTANNQKSKDFLLSFIMKYNIKKTTKDGLKDYSKNTAGAKSILIALWANLPDDETFVEKLWNSNLQKLCFLDGYFDFAKNKFKHYDNETYTITYKSEERRVGKECRYRWSK